MSKRIAATIALVALLSACVSGRSQEDILSRSLDESFCATREIPAACELDGLGDANQRTERSRSRQIIDDTMPC